MKQFIQTIQNIWKIDELRQRILTTLGLVLIYRLGSYVVLPGVDTDKLEKFSSQASEGILGLIDVFSGGAFHNASIFALGIMPYITASIIVQLLGMAVPYFQKLQKEGESGRKRMNQITRYLTVAVTALQAPGYLAGANQLAPGALPDSSFFWVSSTIILVAGTMFVMWLGEKITDRGLGNGISLIIMIGIISRLPGALMQELYSRLNDAGGGLVVFLLEMVILLLIIVTVILLVQGTRRIPVQFAKKIIGNKQYGGNRNYIPLKVNAVGVMPIIFAQAIILIPVYIIGYAQVESQSISGISAAIADYTGFWHNFFLAFLILVFTYFYTAIMINPNQMAEDMKKNGGFVPGIKPGKKTAEFIDAVMSRITLPGALFLAFVAILPSLAQLAGVNSGFSQFFGGTSLLILVGVVLDTLQQIESYLLMRHYDGLMKSGRIKGRSTNSPVSMAQQ
jgi:preprotein translocase subunit SecY